MASAKKKPLILLSGGGTAGSVMPLLAIATELKKKMPNANIGFVGTAMGVEQKLVGKQLRYFVITAGKLRRYWDWRNIIDLFRIEWAFWQSLYICVRYRPAVIVAAGSFVSVPLVWAGWLLGIPSVIHQQDMQIGLATKLMAPFANTITKAFPDIDIASAIWTGNPVRDLTPTTCDFQFANALPTVLIFGGGTGAAGINQLVNKQLCEHANVIHITGKGRATVKKIQHQNYHTFELLTASMAEALQKSTVVIARAGISTISELAALAKPAIIIPMPNSHQQHNAQFLKDHAAAIVVQQSQLTPERLTQVVEKLLHDAQKQAQLKRQIATFYKAQAALELADIVIQYVARKKN